MKKLITLMTIAAMSLALSTSSAQDQAPRQNFQELTKRFDRDGDGRLNEQERQVMRQEMQKRASTDTANRPSREEVIKKYDRNGDGRLDARELAAMRSQMARTRDGAGNRPSGNNRPGGDNRAMIERFDTNKNGRLDPPEQQKMREALQQRQTDKPSQSQRPAQAGDRSSGANRQQALQRFDANGNGRLDPEELQKARAAFEEVRRRGGGQRESSRIQGVEPSSRKPRLETSSLLEKYDANKNGRLDADERQRAMEAMRARSGK